MLRFYEAKGIRPVVDRVFKFDEELVMMTEAPAAVAIWSPAILTPPVPWQRIVSPGPTISPFGLMQFRLIHAVIAAMGRQLASSSLR